MYGHTLFLQVRQRLIKGAELGGSRYSGGPRVVLEHRVGAVPDEIVGIVAGAVHGHLSVREDEDRHARKVGSNVVQKMRVLPEGIRVCPVISRCFVLSDEQDSAVSNHCSQLVAA